jgi:peptidoglycan/LPS O-acetylase OafA/YrhL
MLLSSAPLFGASRLMRDLHVQTTLASPLASPAVLPDRSPKRAFYRPELDIFRFFACFLVMNHHLAPYKPGTSRLALLTQHLHELCTYGVCLFFLLSSFLITELLLREREKTGTVHLRGFYMRRVLRIWPLYFFALLLTVILPQSAPHSLADVQRLAYFVLLAGNWYFVLHGFHTMGYMSSLWTISLEEQFYLVWPSVAKRWQRKGIALFSYAAIALSFVTLAVLVHVHAPGENFYCNSFVQFQFFAVGGVLALALHGKTMQLHGAWRAALFLGGSLALYGAVLLEQDTPTFPFTASRFLSLEVGALMLFFAFYGMQVAKWAGPFVYLGKISYGLYIYHMFVVVFTTWLLHPATRHPGLSFYLENYMLTLALTCAVAALSYHFFEKPFLRFKDRFTFVASRAS